MRTISDHAAADPDKPALIIADVDEAITYGELDRRVNQLSRALQAAGITRGDRVAVMLDNCTAFAVATIATYHSGLYLVPINWHLTAPDAAYIVRDSAAKAIISTDRLSTLAEAVIEAGVGDCAFRLMVGTPAPGWESYDQVIGRHSDQPLDVRMVGGTMSYTSGTTGYPKGVLRQLPDMRIEDAPEGVLLRPFNGAYGIGTGSTYMSAAPFYHSAPLGYLRYVLAEGGVYVAQRKFDAATALSHIERHRVTHSQWVPTMFVKLLRLSDQERSRHDLSSHRCAIHAAAPCPVDVKQAMIAWWGPIIEEYFGATEVGLISRISSQEWLRKQGSVGKSLTAHICDEDGEEVAANQVGQLWIETPVFTYYNDPGKTEASRHPRHPGWATAGDIGYFDDDGYLFLTDRKAFMIISGGVNIYPQIIENALALHPLVEDAAVIGVPDAYLGEAVKAVIQLRPGAAAGAETTEALMTYLHGRVGLQMSPRSIDYVAELPRLPTGKLNKMTLRKAYWATDGKAS
jgi:fatty-acyl-CoA synthase